MKRNGKGERKLVPNVKKGEERPFGLGTERNGRRLDVETRNGTSFLMFKGTTS